MGKFVTSDFFNNNPGPKVTEGLSDLRNNQSAVLELPFSTPPADVTILDDNILPTSAILHVDTEGGASNDELRTITYQLSESETWHDGGVLWLKAKDPARRVTLVNSQTVNGVQTVDGKNIVLSDKYYTTLQLRSGTWYQVKHYQEIYSGASASLSGTSGLVPPASAGDQNKILHGDGTWKSVDVPKLAAAAASPSGKFITLAQNAFPYSAPADGIVRVNAAATEIGRVFRLETNVIRINSSISTIIGNNYDIIIPVAKGNKVTLDLDTYTLGGAYFIYLNGSAPA